MSSQVTHGEFYGKYSLQNIVLKDSYLGVKFSLSRDLRTPKGTAIAALSPVPCDNCAQGSTIVRLEARQTIILYLTILKIKEA